MHQHGDRSSGEYLIQNSGDSRNPRNHFSVAEDVLERAGDEFSFRKTATECPQVPSCFHNTKADLVFVADSCEKMESFTESAPSDIFACPMHQECEPIGDTLLVIPSLPVKRRVSIEEFVSVEISQLRSAAVLPGSMTVVRIREEHIRRYFSADAMSTLALTLAAVILLFVAVGAIVASVLHP